MGELRFMDVLNSVRQCFVQIPVWSLSIRKSYLEVISGWAALVAALTHGKLSWSGNIQSAWDANVGRAPLTLTHNNPVWCKQTRAPTMTMGLSLTWRLKTRGWGWHVSCPLCHTDGCKGHKSQITHRTGWPPATNWRWEGEMLRIAELGECQERAGGRSAPTLRPAAVPGFPPDIWTIARAGHGATLALSRYL